MLATRFRRQTVAFVEREPFWKPAGSSSMISVNTRLYLSWSLSEVGVFAEGNARAAEALRIAEAASDKWIVIQDCWKPAYSGLHNGG